MEKTDLLPDTDEAQKKLEEERASLTEANKALEIARARAEGELDATRKAFEANRPSPTPVQISEEQWVQAESQSGMTRQQIMASSQLAKQMIDQSLTPLQKELDEAKKKAQAAEDRAARLESRTSASSVEADFFKKNPAYAAHDKEVREFLEMFSESDKSDPKKLSLILERSKVYVKGLVGGKMRDQKTGNDGSARLSGGIDDSETDTDKLDYVGIENQGERRTFEDVASRVKERLSDEETKKRFERSSSSDGKGVRFDSEAEWKNAEKGIRK